jgi:hypothetical protein
MEVIKRQFKIVTTTGTTTGCTGNCYVIIPYSGTGVTYNTNFLLTANNKDWGFFDTFEQSGATGATISAGTYTVTGTSSSRLSELRKYSRSGTLSQLYFTSTDPSVNGVNLSLTTTGTTASTYVYYVSGITYTDNIITGTTETSFEFVSSGYSSPAFTNLPYIKNENEQNIITSPLISNDVFIIRDENSAFEKNYRLKNINNLTELTYYAGGAYFNIVENT